MINPLLRVERAAQSAAQTPTEPGVRISRTLLFRNWFTALHIVAIWDTLLKASDAIKVGSHYAHHFLIYLPRDFHPLDKAHARAHIDRTAGSGPPFSLKGLRGNKLCHYHVVVIPAISHINCFGGCRPIIMNYHILVTV